MITFYNKYDYNVFSLAKLSTNHYLLLSHYWLIEGNI